MKTATAHNLIDGQWTGEPGTARLNPADPGHTVALSPASTAGDLDAAVTAAVSAQPAWAALPPPARGAILLDAADLLRQRHTMIAEDLVAEEGKTRAEAMGEVRRAIDVLRYFGSQGWRLGGETYPSGLPNTQIHTRNEPIGVAGLITPWNFPIAIPAWKMAPALVSGNAVVIKPAELTPLSATHLARALVDAGLPAGVLNVVHGKGAVIGDALARDSRVGALSFTGSTQVGLQLADILNARRARVQLEMGGKNGYLVLDDAQADRAAQIVAAGGFGLTGQACTATSRVYCTPAIYDRFVTELARVADTFEPGPGLEAKTTMGPVVSAAQLEIDLSAIRRGVSDGASLVAGSTESEGQFLRPAVLAGVAHDSDLNRNEVFGPVVAVGQVVDYEEGLSQINDSPYGLTAGICTQDLSKAHHFGEHAAAGVVKINRPTAGLDLNVPFGGIKDSSTNTFREQGPHAVDFYTWSKTVYLGHDG